MWRRVVTLALVIALGLLSRTRPIGVPLYDANLGDALYAAAVYLVLGLLRPRWATVTLAGAAFALCLAIELFQLSGVPARHASLPLVRWLLGTHFAWVDLLCYGVGVLAMLGLESGARASDKR